MVVSLKKKVYSFFSKRKNKKRYYRKKVEGNWINKKIKTLFKNPKHPPLPPSPPIPYSNLEV